MSQTSTVAKHHKVPVGHVLATLRHRLHYSIESAASALDLTERELSHIESGIRTASEELIERMAHLYGVNPDRLGTRGVVPRVPAALDNDKNVIWLGWLPVELDAVHDTEALVQSISRNIRSMRCLGESHPIYIRDTDVSLLAAVIDLDDTDLPSIFMRHLKLTLMETVELIDRLSESKANKEPVPVL